MLIYKMKTMIKQIFPLIVITLIITTPASSLSTDSEIEKNSDIVEENFWKNSKKFVTSLYTECGKINKDQSLIISPISIHTCLTLLLNGAAGNTAKQLAENLQINSTLSLEKIGENFHQLLKQHQQANSLIHIANGIYVDEKIDIKANFKELIMKNYFTDLQILDFTNNEKSSNTINEWINNKTNKKISKIIEKDDLGPDTKIVLVNAIHFKGNWKAPFLENLTTKQEFWLNSNQSIQVDMMKHKHATNRMGIKVAENIKELDSSAVEIPYDDSKLSMVIILPNNIDGLQNLEEKLSNDENLNLVLRKLNNVRLPFPLMIPKFTVGYEINLKEPLTKMGMGQLFSGQADLSNLSDAPLKVSKAIHKAFISVDEKGTEADATTALTIIPRILYSFQFNANHPFVYLIKDNADQIYFIGRITGTNFSSK